jgi:hypothetical protein
MAKKTSLELLTESVREVIKERELLEQQNTLAADVNEIAFGYYALGETWNGFMNASEAQPAFESRKEAIGEEATKDQLERAKAMAQEAIKWANENGFDGVPVKAWWTARPGVLSKAVGYEVDSRKNPTDILLQFSDGSFLGISAKSTKSSGDIGFKNPGIGSLSRAIGTDLGSQIAEIEREAIEKYNLPAKSKERKEFIRSNPEIRQETIALGQQILNQLRDELFEYYKANFTNKSFGEHIKELWLDAKGADPYYIKVTGRGKGGNYSATVHDPTKNEKLKALSADASRISMTPVGNDSIGIHIGPLRIMKIRFKYESEKLASTIKLSGDPW